MKHLILIIVMLLVATSAYAGKQFELTSIDELFGRIFFNENVGTQDEPEYYPITIQFVGRATGAGISLPVGEMIRIGGKQSDGHTPKELYTLLVNAFGQNAANKVKNIYINGINEDISL